MTDFIPDCKVFIVGGTTTVLYSWIKLDDTHYYTVLLLLLLLLLLYEL